MQKIIKLGKGDHVLNHGKMEGIPCIFIEPSEITGVPNTDAGKPENKTELAEDGLCVSFSDARSIDALIKHLIEAKHEIMKCKGLY